MGHAGWAELWLRNPWSVLICVGTQPLLIGGNGLRAAIIEFDDDGTDEARGLGVLPPFSAATDTRFEPCPNM